MLIGGSDWIRTSDQRLMSPLLYRLSYAAIEAKFRIASSIMFGSAVKLPLILILPAVFAGW